VSLPDFFRRISLVVRTSKAGRLISDVARQTRRNWAFSKLQSNLEHLVGRDRNLLRG
jgi:hypothetical protein